MKGSEWAGKGTYTNVHDKEICAGTWEMNKK